MIISENETITCLCGSGLSYINCCRPYHQQQSLPASAEALMRSRFSAYVLRNTDYLLNTWDTSKRPATLDFSKETAQWQTLVIVDTKKGGPSDTKGIVEFKAYYLQDEIECVLHEISRFIKSNGRWLYVDGVIKAAGKVVNSSPQQPRNALCPCGSGKKFKRCCAA